MIVMLMIKKYCKLKDHQIGEYGVAADSIYN